VVLWKNTLADILRCGAAGKGDDDHPLKTIRQMSTTYLRTPTFRSKKDYYKSSDLISPFRREVMEWVGIPPLRICM
jgi:hypothetical protein